MKLVILGKKNSARIILGSAILVTTNGFVFSVADLQHAGLLVLIGKEGLFLNSFALIVAWWAFIFGVRNSRFEMACSVALMSYINYMFLSNLFYVIMVRPQNFCSEAIFRGACIASG